MDKRTSYAGRWLSRLGARSDGAHSRLAVVCEDNATTASLLLKLIQRAQSDHDVTNAGKWLRQLEACSAALRTADTSLRQDYVSSPLPLSPRAERAAAKHRKCYRLLSEAFSTLAHHLARTTTSRSRHRSEMLEAAIVAGLQCGKNALLISQLVYSPPPVGLWQTIHRLYVLTSEEESAHGARLLDNASPRAVYLHALLLGVASPETLSRAQLLALDRLLAHWTHLAQLHAPGVPPASGWYAITAQTDSAPTRVRYGAHDPDQVWLYLDVSQLAYRLKLLDAAAGQANHDESRLCGHLAAVWTAGRDRRYSRHHQSVRMSASVGLVAIQNRLRRRPAASTVTVEPNVVPTHYPVIVVDDSPEGACLLWRPEKNHESFLRVGAVIGIFTLHGEQPSLHALGHVRWMKCPGDGALMAGVAWLSAEAVPVGIERAPAREGTSKHPGLLLTGDIAGWREPRLLAPLSLEAGERLTLHNGRQLWPTRVCDLRDTGLGYAVYAVQLQPAAAAVPPTAPDHWRAGA